MMRFIPYLGVAAAILVGAGAYSVYESVPVVIPEPSLESLAILPPVLEENIVEEVTPEPEIEEVPPVQSEEKVLSIEIAVPQTPILLPTLGGDVEKAAQDLRAALVNIICYAPAGSGIRSSTGSGVFVSDRGLILTNAHIAQKLLFKSEGVSCVIRTGSPARDAYEARLAFFPRDWVVQNADILTLERPTGTGENDYAFLAVSGSATNEPLPETFPFVPLSSKPLAPGSSVAIASYGAQFLEAGQVLSALFPTVVYGSVKDVHTFSGNAIDVLSLGGSAAAQQGSSGGGVSSSLGELSGIITTSTIEGETALRALDAITTAYIRADYAAETGLPLDFLLSADPIAAASGFAPRIPALAEVLLGNLP